KKNNDISYDSEEQVGSDLPAFLPAISGPLVVICLLALRPLFGITIDPLIALPLGGLISILATGYLKETVPFVEYGLSKVVGVSILLIGTGTLSGIIKASNL
ncbi:GntP family permease, partial [Streptococcus agalactiae]|nr:GntP family permease [Streptococcus agalactiae]